MEFLIGFITGVIGTACVIWAADHPDAVSAMARDARAWIAARFRKGDKA